MLHPKQILRFALLVGVYATVLLIPWQVVERGYAAVFRAESNFLFSRFWLWPEGRARFIDLHRSPQEVFTDIDLATPGQLPRSFRPPVAEDVRDTLVLVMNKNQPQTFGQFRISSRLVGYWPTAWLVALVLAKPMSWRRRGWGLLWGLLLVHVFLAFRLSVKLLAGGFALSGKAYALFTPSPFWADLLRRLDEVFVEDPTVSFVIPTLIWFVVAFTWKEWASWRKMFAGDDEETMERDRAAGS